MTTKQAARVPDGPHGCAQGRKGSQACRTGDGRDMVRSLSTTVQY
jgi:hypothetical protein